MLSVGQKTVAEWPEIPPVCYDPDLMRIFGWKQRTIQKRRAAGAFPIPELLPQVDKRHMYSRADVIRFLERQDSGRMAAFRKRA